MKWHHTILTRTSASSRKIMMNITQLLSGWVNFQGLRWKPKLITEHKKQEVPRRRIQHRWPEQATRLGLPAVLSYSPSDYAIALLKTGRSLGIVDKLYRWCSDHGKIFSPCIIGCHNDLTGAADSNHCLPWSSLCPGKSLTARVGKPR